MACSSSKTGRYYFLSFPQAKAKWYYTQIVSEIYPGYKNSWGIWEKVDGIFIPIPTITGTHDEEIVFCSWYLLTQKYLWRLNFNFKLNRYVNPCLPYDRYYIAKHFSGCWKILSSFAFIAKRFIYKCRCWRLDMCQIGSITNIDRHFTSKEEEGISEKVPATHAELFFRMVKMSSRLSKLIFWQTNLNILCHQFLPFHTAGPLSVTETIQKIFLKTLFDS